MTTKPIELLNTHMKLFMEASGRLYEVTHITKDMAVANTICDTYATLAVISEDREGNIYIAKLRQHKLEA